MTTSITASLLDHFGIAAAASGGELPVVSPASPELQLFANDAWFAYFNNHGSVRIGVNP
jgi:hypothetical protein